MMSEEKNWKGNEKSVYVTLGASDHTDKVREENDYYATDPTAIDDLFQVEDFSDKIWEPACGEGHLSKRMEKHGKDLYSTDIVDRGFGDEFFDFLESNKDWDGDIITNPPYKYAKDFVLKALESIDEGNKVAMFMKLTFLESKDRVELFKKYPPTKVWVYSYRKNVSKGGRNFDESSAVCYAWFVWEKGHPINPKIGWITEEGELEFIFQNTLDSIEEADQKQ